MKSSNIYKHFLVVLIGVLVLTFIVFVLVQAQRAFFNIDTELPMSELESEIYEEDLINTSVISSIEGNAEFKFPPSSRDIYAYTTGLRDIYIQVRFTIDKEDLEEFIDNTRCNAPLEAFLFPDVETNVRFSWWEVSKSNHLQSCTGSSEHFSQEVLVDMTNQEFYVIYVSGGTH